MHNTNKISLFDEDLDKGTPKVRAYRKKQVIVETVD